MNRHFILALICLTTIQACKPKAIPQSMVEKQPPHVAYQQAKAFIAQKQYEQAITQLTDIQAYYPYGNMVDKAQLAILYIHIKNNAHESAILEAERFLQLNPTHKNIDYVYCMKALALYSQNFQPAKINRIYDKFNLDRSLRDQKEAEEALLAFQELLTKFPHTKYKKFALARMFQLKQQLAQHELNVAQVYFKRKNKYAALSRINYLMLNFPEITPVIKQALALKQTIAL